MANFIGNKGIRPQGPHRWHQPFMAMPNNASVTIENDVLLPSQWLKDRASTPERRLMLAVLQDAFSCYLKPKHDHKSGTHIQMLSSPEYALRWFESDDEAWPYSFVNVCMILGLEPDWVRRKLFDRKAAA